MKNRILVVSTVVMLAGVLAILVNTPNVKAGVMATIGCDSFQLVENEPLKVTVTVTNGGQSVEGKEVKCALDKGEFYNLQATAGTAKKDVDPRKFCGITDEDGKVYVYIFADEKLVRQEVVFTYEVDGAVYTERFRVLGNPPEHSGPGGTIHEIESMLEVKEEDSDSGYPGDTALVLHINQDGKPYIDASQLTISWEVVSGDVGFQIDTNDSNDTVVRNMKADPNTGQPDRCYSVNILSWLGDSTSATVRVKVINIENGNVILTQDHPVQKP